MALITDYTTLANLKARLRITDTVDDAILSAIITAASRAIDRYCRRHFGADTVAVARFYTPDTLGSVLIDDLSSTTSLVLATDEGEDGAFETAWTIDVDFRVYPFNAALESRPFWRIDRISTGARSFPARPKSIRVTGLWGWPSTPADVAEASLIQAARLFRRADTPLGIAGFEGVGVTTVPSLDPDVRRMLVGFRRPGLA